MGRQRWQNEFIQTFDVYYWSIYIFICSVTSVKGKTGWNKRCHCWVFNAWFVWQPAKVQFLFAHVCVSPQRFHFTNLPVQTASSLRRRLSSSWFMSLIKSCVWVCVCVCVCSSGPYCPLQSLHKLSFHNLCLPPWLTIAVNVAVNVSEVPLSDLCPWARAQLLLPVCSFQTDVPWRDAGATLNYCCIVLMEIPAPCVFVTVCCSFAQLMAHLNLQTQQKGINWNWILSSASFTMEHLEAVSTSPLSLKILQLLHTQPHTYGNRSIACPNYFVVIIVFLNGLKKYLNLDTTVTSLWKKY